MLEPRPGDTVVHIKELGPGHRYIVAASLIKKPAVIRSGRYFIRLRDRIQIKNLPLKNFLSKYGKRIRAEIERAENIELYPFRRKKDTTDEVVPAKKYLTKATPRLVSYLAAAIGGFTLEKNENSEPHGGGDGPRRSPPPAEVVKNYLVNYEAMVSPRHHILQSRFEKYLSATGIDFESNRDFVDLRFHDDERGFVFVEIKPCDPINVRYAIRAAMWQLLDYAQKIPQVRSLIVVEVPPSSYDRNLALKNGFAIAFPARGRFEMIWPDAAHGGT
jgi:hypothetical protein